MREISEDIRKELTKRFFRPTIEIDVNKDTLIKHSSKDWLESDKSSNIDIIQNAFTLKYEPTAEVDDFSDGVIDDRWIMTIGNGMIIEEGGVLKQIAGEEDQSGYAISKWDSELDNVYANTPLSVEVKANFVSFFNNSVMTIGFSETDNADTSYGDLYMKVKGAHLYLYYRRYRSDDLTEVSLGYFPGNQRPSGIYKFRIELVNRNVKLYIYNESDELKFFREYELPFDYVGQLIFNPTISTFASVYDLPNNPEVDFDDFKFSFYGYAGSGWLETVFDCGNPFYIKRYGRFFAEYDNPTLTNINFYIAGRNGEDESWTEYQPINNNDVIKFGSNGRDRYRYIKIRTELYTETPILRPVVSSIGIEIYGIFSVDVRDIINISEISEGGEKQLNSFKYGNVRITVQNADRYYDSFLVRNYLNDRTVKKKITVRIGYIINGEKKTIPLFSGVLDSIKTDIKTNTAKITFLDYLSSFKSSIIEIMPTKENEVLGVGDGETTEFGFEKHIIAGDEVIKVGDTIIERDKYSISEEDRKITFDYAPSNGKQIIAVKYRYWIENITVTDLIKMILMSEGFTDYSGIDIVRAPVNNDNISVYKEVTYPKVMRVIEVDEWNRYLYYAIDDIVYRWKIGDTDENGFPNEEVFCQPYAGYKVHDIKYIRYNGNEYVAISVPRKNENKCGYYVYRIDRSIYAHRDISFVGDTYIYKDYLVPTNADFVPQRFARIGVIGKALLVYKEVAGRMVLGLWDFVKDEEILLYEPYYDSGITGHWTAILRGVSDVDFEVINIGFFDVFVQSHRDEKQYVCFLFLKQYIVKRGDPNNDIDDLFFQFLYVWEDDEGNVKFKWFELTPYISYRDRNKYGFPLYKKYYWMVDYICIAEHYEDYFSVSGFFSQCGYGMWLNMLYVPLSAFYPKYDGDDIIGITELIGNGTMPIYVDWTISQSMYIAEPYPPESPRLSAMYHPKKTDDNVIYCYNEDDKKVVKITGYSEEESRPIMEDVVFCGSERANMIRIVDDNIFFVFDNVLYTNSVQEAYKLPLAKFGDITKGEALRLLAEMTSYKMWFVVDKFYFRSFDSRDKTPVYTFDASNIIECSRLEVYRTIYDVVRITYGDVVGKRRTIVYPEGETTYMKNVLDISLPLCSIDIYAWRVAKMYYEMYGVRRYEIDIVVKYLIHLDVGDVIEITLPELNLYRTKWVIVKIAYNITKFVVKITARSVSPITINVWGIGIWGISKWGG